MDKNYLSRIKLRSQTIQAQGRHVLAMTSEEAIGLAVRELYVYLFGTYLPMRFASMFKIHDVEYETGKTFMLENKITGSLYPAFPIPPETKTTTLLETLGKNLDEDFLFLTPEESPEGEDKSDFVTKYILQAYICCCPSGFDPLQKLGLRLASIHEPVPGYKEKLEGSMDRFFSKLEVGKYVKRANWSVTVDTELYAGGDGTNHAHVGDEVVELEEIDVEKVSHLALPKSVRLDGFRRARTNLKCEDLPTL